MPEDTQVVKYQASKAIGSPSTLKSLLEQNRGSIALALPAHLTPDKLIRAALVAVNHNSALLDCTQSSILESLMCASELGLSVSPTLGEGALVPYKDKCQFQPMYRGLAKLARQSGEISTIQAEAVYANDHFVYEKGTSPKIEFRPKLTGGRGELLGFFALVLTKDGASQSEWMDVEAVNRIKAKSRASGNGPWVTDYSEMGRKTVFKRLAKWLNLSNEKFHEAIQRDNLEFEQDLASVRDVTPKANVEDAMKQIEGTSILDEPQSVISEMKAALKG